MLWFLFSEARSLASPDSVLLVQNSRGHLVLCFPFCVCCSVYPHFAWCWVSFGDIVSPALNTQSFSDEEAEAGLECTEIRLLLRITV